MLFLGIDSKHFHSVSFPVFPEIIGSIFSYVKQFWRFKESKQNKFQQILTGDSIKIVIFVRRRWSNPWWSITSIERSDLIWVEYDLKERYTNSPD